MAAALGKKGKKGKAKAVSLQDFLASSNGGSTSTVQVSKKLPNWDEQDDDEEFERRPQMLTLSLPTAPRANRDFNDDSVPRSPPFMAYLSNLSYDVNEDDICDFFYNIEVNSVRLPRDDTERRLRGFGYVEFKSRDDLIAAISLPDPTIRGRRIRIDVSNENDQKRGSGRNNKYDNFGNSENRGESTNWRKGNDRDDRDSSDRHERRERQGFGGFNRDRAPRDDENKEESNWRTGTRPTFTRNSPPAQRRGFGEGYNRSEGRNRRNYDDRRRDEPLKERPKLNLTKRTLPLPESAVPKDDDIDETPNGGSHEEDDKPRPVHVPAERIFGNAKPVDTAAREREIEERLERERLEKKEQLEEERKRKAEEEQLIESEEKANSNKDEDSADINKEDKSKETTKDSDMLSWRRKDPVDPASSSFNSQHSPKPNRRHSPDRRGPPRRHDDRGDRRNDRRGGEMRDSHRDYKHNRDNRDYRDQRNDHRDHRDHRDNRDNRDYNRHNDRDNYHRDRDNRGRDNRGGRGDDRMRRNENNYRDDQHVNGRTENNDPDAPIKMPQFKETSGPKLSMSNKYQGLDESGSD